MCLIGCISATNDTGIDNYKSIPTTSDIQQQDITPTTNTQNEIQTKNNAVESNKDIVASNVNENTNIKTDTNIQATNTSNTLKSDAGKTANSKTVKQETKKDTTKIKVTDTTSYPGKTVQLKAQITSSKTVNKGTVIFKINGKTYGQTSVKNGIATMNYGISSSFKNPTYIITAVYKGNDEFSESRANGTLYLKNVTKTNVKVTTITAYPGNSVQLKATITGGSKTIKTGKVAFKINGKTITTTTVKNGVATLKYTIPKTYSNPTYTITAVYGENGEYKSSTSSGLLYLKNVTKTSVKVTSITSYPGKTVQLKAQINCGKNVNTGKVAFKINGKTITTTTVKNGVATLKYTIPKTYSNPTYTITAVYGQSGEFKESRANGILYLKNVTKTSVKVTSITSYSGKTVQLKAQINCGKNVNTGKVAFKINGKTVGHANVKNGVATLNYAIPSSFKNPTYTITVVYGQSGEFKESRANGTLYINTKYKEYLTATKNCDAYSSYFKSIVNSVTSKISGTYNKAVALFNYANNRLGYSGYYNTRYGSTQTCKQAFGNCCDMAHVVVALMRTAGIPARYNHATCYFSSGLVTGHVWAEVYVNDKWYKCDTTSAKNSFGVIRNWYKCGTIKIYKALPF